MNQLYYGDCLTIMQDWPSQCVDLIYLDPPFNSNRQYNAIYRDETGRPLPDQIEAFCDMWELDAERERAIRTMPVLMRENGIDDSTAELWRLWMRALRDTQPRLLAYLSYMTERLLIMSRLLKPAGSLYFHCDPTVSHYIKPLLDAVFGHDNFRSDITWRRNNPTGRGKRRLANNADNILYYAKGDTFTWNPQFKPHGSAYVTKTYRYKDPSTGQRYRLDNLKGAGLRNGDSGQPWRGVNPSDTGSHWAVPNTVLPESVKSLSTQEKLDYLDNSGRIYWPPKGKIPSYKRYLDEMYGTPIDTIWDDISNIGSNAKERMGYNTQKPLALLERIIAASSNPGDVVLDPFCGCATTLEAAHKLDRQWIGIDIAIHAVKRVARIRLQERLGLIEGQDFTVEGVPSTMEGAQDLWRRDKYHFQKWAVEQIEGFVTTKRTADGGVDGRVYFAVPGEKDLQSMVVEVKGGKNVNIVDWRALKGVLSRDDALMAGLIIMEPLNGTKARNFNREVMDLKPLNIIGINYPRMQILTVGEIMEGKRFQTPTVAGRHQLEPRLPGIPA